MSEEENKASKLKQKKAGLGTTATAIIGMLTALGGAAKAHYEHGLAQQKAAAESQDRVAVDRSIQEEVQNAIDDLYDRQNEAEEREESRDRDLFELRVTVKAQAQIIEQMGGIDQEFREFIMLEALESEAREEDHVVHTKPKAIRSDPEPEAQIKVEAEKIAKKTRKKRKERPAAKLDFLEPKLHYQQIQQQIQQQMQQQLPTLPPPPGEK